MLKRIAILLASSCLVSQAFAASTTLGNLSAGSTIGATDLFYDVQSVGSGGVKVTGTQMGVWAQTYTLGHTGTWTAAQTFTNSDIKLLGSSTGATTFTSGNAGASNFTLTFPGVTDTLAVIGTAQTWTAAQTFTNSDLKLLGSSSGVSTFTSANASASNFTITFPAATANLGYLIGSAVNGDCVEFSGTAGGIADTGSACGAGGGGSPGGATTDIQFNSSSSFGGDSHFTYGGAGAVVTLTPAANTAQPFLITGGSTTSAGTSAVGLSVVGTLNTSGSVDGAAFFSNITNTASGAATTLLDLQVGSTSMFNVNPIGQVFVPVSSSYLVPSYTTTANNQTGLSFYAGGANFAFISNGVAMLLASSSEGSVVLGPTVFLAFGATPGLPDSGMSRDSSGVFDFGNGNASDKSGTLNAAHANLNALDNSATTSAVCYNTGTGALTYDATVGTCTTSTARVKHDIAPLNDTAMLDGVLRMRPVSFEYNDEVRTPGTQLGLIAEDMAAIDPNLVAYDAEGKPVAIKFLGPMMAYLIGALKAQQAEINILKQRVH